MRRRLIWGTIAVIAAVLLALVPPVVILLRRAAERELEVRLSSQASAVSIEIADELLAGEVPSIGAIQPLVQPGDELVILDATGTQILHLGDDVGDGITGRAAGPAGTTVEVRVAREALDRRVRTPLLALGAFALGSILLGAALAWFVGRRLTRPLDQLAVTAARLGDGDFSAPPPPPSKLPEIDGIGAALRASAARLDDMLTAERSFTGDATHQLRTGLAGISLQLQMLLDGTSADGSPGDPVSHAAATEALRQVERLTGHLDELLALAEGGAGRQRVSFDLGRLVAHHCQDWRARFTAAGRTLRVDARPGSVVATPGLVGQVVDVLLDNALRHGAGTVTVTVDDAGVTVADSGNVEPGSTAGWFTDAAPGARHGRGLPLARRLVRADGGGLDLAETTPVTFRVTYPRV